MTEIVYLIICMPRHGHKYCVPSRKIEDIVCSGMYTRNFVCQVVVITFVCPVTRAGSLYAQKFMPGKLYILYLDLI